MWSPDGKHLSFLSDPDTVFIADIDRNGAMTDLLQLPTATQAQGHLAWSPDGRHLSFVSLDDHDSATVNIADIDQDGEVTALHQTDLRQLDHAAGSAAILSYPKWSPDSSHLAFVQTIDNSPLRAGIVNADGSDYRLVGPEMSDRASIDHAFEQLDHPEQLSYLLDRLHARSMSWSPDGRSLVIFEVTEFDQDPEGWVATEGRTWLVDAATGEQTEVQTPVDSWQGLAP